jgi:hypothetical protein
MRAITTAAVEKFIKDGVPVGKPYATLRCGDRLSLRLQLTGSASWHFIYRAKGAGRGKSPITITIGPWPTIGVKTATEEARRLAGEVASGRDPRAQMREAKRRERAVVTVALDDYEAWITAAD